MIEWPDNMDTSTWYYAQVQEATNSHDYEKFDAYEVWTGIQAVRDWAALEKLWSEAKKCTNILPTFIACEI